MAQLRLNKRLQRHHSVLRVSSHPEIFGLLIAASQTNIYIKIIYMKTVCKKFDLDPVSKK